MPVGLQRKTMTGSGPHLLWATLVLGSLFTGVVLSGNGGTQQAESVKVALRQKGKLVRLHCEGGNVTKWSQDGKEVQEGGQELSLGSSLDDPRGIYTCHIGHREASLQVYFRMCQNCIRLDLPTILGLLLASGVSIAFLAVAVYYLATEEPGWQLQASRRAQQRTVQPHWSGQHAPPLKGVTGTLSLSPAIPLPCLNSLGDLPGCSSCFGNCVFHQERGCFPRQMKGPRELEAGHRVLFHVAPVSSFVQKGKMPVAALLRI
ncbi:hypothetical protein JRQ81_011318 [Phrynocephalus forsythii]|uniref:CD3 gamma/delta subunit Ig-like domain-containing protein n=1 Tax=Phrynocephalus forsythii TaxID=171643 RepID=A0A9Q0X8D4_9SAUR|nr:hypothetical protein JRQ81_011318 [Phrynocephalus forsythii]